MKLLISTLVSVLFIAVISATFTPPPGTPPISKGNGGNINIANGVLTGDFDAYLAYMASGYYHSPGHLSGPPRTSTAKPAPASPTPANPAPADPAPADPAPADPAQGGTGTNGSNGG